MICDIGNTNITIGLFRDEDLTFRIELPTLESKRLRTLLKNILKSENIIPAQIKASLICSVVPGINREIKRAIRDVIYTPVYVLGNDLSVPIKNLYSRPEQVGQDRLVCAYSALKLYGAPVITVDLGTAVTFDVVSKNKEYLGGIILPGLALSLSALHRNTALLPEIKLASPIALIGRDTKASMLSGIAFGFGSMIDGLIARLKRELKASPKVIATGGNGYFIKPYCKKIDYFEPDLILKGMGKIIKR